MPSKIEILTALAPAIIAGLFWLGCWISPRDEKRPWD
jgi:hypothetical protein